MRLAIALLLVVSQASYGSPIRECLLNLSDAQRQAVQAETSFSVEELLDLDKIYDLTVSFECFESDWAGDPSCMADYDPRVIEGKEAAGEVFFRACGLAETTL